MARILLAKARNLGDHQNSASYPLGVMYLASVLRRHGHDVHLHDDLADGPDLALFRRRLRDLCPDILGLSAVTFEARRMEQMARACREVSPGTKVVVGGPHPSAYPDLCANCPDIDHVVVGEGETVAPGLIEAISRDGGGLVDLPGVASRRPDGAIHRGPAAALVTDLDTIPMPAWDLVDMALYARFSSMGPVGYRRYATLSTSRGCPYRCVYCHKVHGKRFRPRSPDVVLEEIRHLHDRYGVREFEIVDDIFNFDKDRMAEILVGIIRSGMRISLDFPNALRSDLLDRDQIRLLRRAGGRYVVVAVETAVPRIQKLVRKELHLERVRENIAIASEEGLFVGGYFMLGFPTETLEEARRTVEFAVGSRLHIAMFFIVTPYEGTDLKRLGVETADRRDGFEALNYHTGMSNLSTMSNDELFALQSDAYRRFYLSPGRIARIALRHPRPLSVMSRYAWLAGSKMAEITMRPGRRKHGNGA